MSKRIIKKLYNESGMALTASTLFIFIVLSIMAFYLARFSILSSESTGYYVQNIRARNLVQTGLEIGLRTIQNSYSLLLNPLSGQLNKGSYTISMNENNDENSTPLKYSHYSMLKSVSEIGGVKRSARLIISSYPNAFNLAFFGENNANSTFSTASLISGDIYFNGDFGTLNLSFGSYAYSSLLNPSNNGVFHGSPLVEFPLFDNSYYENLLSTVSGSYGSGGGNSPALYFDGSNDYASIKNMHYDQKGEIPNLTVSAWVKLPSNGGGWSVVDFDRSEYYTCAVGIANGNTTAEGDRVAFHTAGENSYIHDMWSNTPIRDNQWHHIVWVYNSSEVNEKKIYVDGVLDKEMSAYPTNERLGYQGRLRRYGFLGDGSEAVSYNSNRNGQYYRGYMDEVSIWHRSFPANEISLLENVDDVPVTISLQAYWKMDEGSGTTLYDAHGNNDAILINGPSWQTREGVGSPGVVESQTINLSGLTDNILVNDDMLTINNCIINGPGVVMTNGDLTISGNSTIGPDVKIISGGNLTVSGNVTIGSSVENYSIIYCKNNLNLGSNTTFYGVLIGRGSSSIFSNANLYGASYLESQTVSMSNTSVVGSLVSKYSLVMDGASSITKGNLPDIFGTNIGFNPSVLPGSHLEY
tara:strand:- start:2206 stop:4122 length:1917 start_codon:yes stop_codon:yes gene_type:complete